MARKYLEDGIKMSQDEIMSYFKLPPNAYNMSANLLMSFHVYVLPTLPEPKTETIENNIRQKLWVNIVPAMQQDWANYQENEKTDEALDNLFGEILSYYFQGDPHVAIAQNMLQESLPMLLQAFKIEPTIDDPQMNETFWHVINDIKENYINQTFESVRFNFNIDIRNWVTAPEQIDALNKILEEKLPELKDYLNIQPSQLEKHIEAIHATLAKGIPFGSRMFLANCSDEYLKITRHRQFMDPEIYETAIAQIRTEEKARLNEPEINSPDVGAALPPAETEVVEPQPLTERGKYKTIADVENRIIELMDAGLGLALAVTQFCDEVELDPDYHMDIALTNKIFLHMHQKLSEENYQHYPDHKYESPGGWIYKMTNKGIDRKYAEQQSFQDNGLKYPPENANNKKMKAWEQKRTNAIELVDDLIERRDCY